MTSRDPSTVETLWYVYQSPDDLDNIDLYQIPGESWSALLVLGSDLHWEEAAWFFAKRIQDWPSPCLPREQCRSFGQQGLAWWKAVLSYGEMGMSQGRPSLDSRVHCRVHTAPRGPLI